MSKDSGFYPTPRVDGAGVATVGHAGGMLLLDTVRAVGLDRGLSAALTPWRRPMAHHDPGKVVCDLAVSLAVGGDCLADVGLLRATPQVFGLVASDPTVSRLLDTLAADATAALAAINGARAAARAAAWQLAGKHAPDFAADARRPLIVDVDATLVTSHSVKEGSAATFKRGLVTIRWRRSSITARTAPANRWPCCCGRVMPAQILPPITSPSSRPRWPSCPPGCTAGKC